MEIAELSSLVMARRGLLGTKPATAFVTKTNLGGLL